MHTKKILRFSALTLLVVPMLGSCGYPNNVVPRSPFLAVLSLLYTPAGACPDMALINKSSELVRFTASGGVGSGTQQLQVDIQPGSAQALAPAFAAPYMQHTLTSKGGSKNSDTGNVSYSLGVRCSATSSEVTKSFTLLGDTTNTLKLVEDSTVPSGVTLALN